MTARMLVVAIIVCTQPAAAAQLATSVELGPATVRLEQSEVLHVTRECTLALREGESLLSLPLERLGVSAADAWLRIEPADCVSVVAMETGPQAPGAGRWRVGATRDVLATVSVTYPVKGLTWALEYTGTLRDDGGLDLEGKLRITNGLGRDLTDARLVGDGFGTRLSIADGETVTVAQPALALSVPPDGVVRELVYDHAVHGDAVTQVVHVRPHVIAAAGEEAPAEDEAPPEDEATAQAPARVPAAIPPGTARIYGPPQAGSEFITEASIPYTPAGESIALTLGPASGISVTRTRAATKEIDKRVDAHEKIALFTLEETWELELRNLREAPVTVTVREHHEGAWEIDDAPEECAREDAETLVFVLTIEPGQTKDLSYRIRHPNQQP